MAVHHTYDTDESVIPEALRRFFWHRVYEICALALTAVIVLLGVALATWCAQDPSLNHSVATRPLNWLGTLGALAADFLMQPLGLAAIALILIPLSWAAKLFQHQLIPNWKMRIMFWLVSSLALALLLATTPKPAAWGLSSGLGGYAGEIQAVALLSLLSVAVKGVAANAVLFLVAFSLTLWLMPQALGLSISDFGKFRRKLPIKSGLALLVGGAIMVVKFALRLRPRKPTRVRPAARDDAIENDRIGRFRPLSLKHEIAEFDEPHGMDDFEPDDETQPEPLRKATKLAPRVKAKPTRHRFELPSLDLLTTPKKLGRVPEMSKDQLEENARQLECVLDDYGVKGQIIAVRPGPVVTLYELEPAPGIKSSRVISLADDIARSMSAISARVAVVQGRNAIGIELPNAKRETVYLRELFEEDSFVKDNTTLNFALGKNIGGEPIYANLARMPHLLIAGTTGSGKSVGINTMILSLLYRLPPDKCKLIMIDPKMLELSVYEGIPHLLAPVVTDPRKAVVALKWAVREMEDRYKRMSKCGVRNVDGYNAKIAQLAAKGEKMSRTVQTGFDTKTGEPIFEQEELDFQPLPYIVVIIDEMADLMMVAGKDIEGAVQRLAQMARAAGIHVVMATQRPSVDVITGTIKANFPTRISFQVTSKIDSRTILGEQGAEQLLGQGDMLYMAGGGRISRLHGPFVSDTEVEAIVNHLKAQGQPEYLEAVTEEEEDVGGQAPLAGGEGGSGDDLYGQAVQVVLRDKKVSTSYVQRRLGVGYNKAATLIERMEQEGVISAPNGQGKRNILVPGDSAHV